MMSGMESLIIGALLACAALYLAGRARMFFAGKKKGCCGSCPVAAPQKTMDRR